MHQSSGVGSADDPLNRMHRRDGLRSSSSDVDCTSSSEQSCDTVIFVGPRERTLHEGVEVVPSVERRFGIVNPTQTSPLTPIAKPSFAQIRRTSTSTTEDSTHRVISGPGMGYHHSSPNGRQGGARLVDPLSKQQFYVCPERKGSINVQPPTYQASEHASSELTIDNINARTLKQMVSGTKSSCGEFWVDGPCVTSTKFSNVVQKDWSASKCPSPTSPSPNTETWVDGPRAQHCDYFLDEQKRAMIERWIDLQTSSFLSNETSEDALPPADFFLEHDRNYRATLDQDRLSRAGEAEIISNVDSFVSGDTETEKNNAWPVSHEGTMENLSNTVDSQWNEHCKSMEFYCHVVRHIGEVGDEEEPVEQETSRDDQREVKNLELGRAGENIVPVMDSWVQVTEFEIACECLSLADEANDEDDHPLRVLSSESLAISFADSSQMSWDSGLNAVRQAYAVTNRTADRSHISVGVGTDEKEDDDDKMDDRRRWSFEALSVQSDPGSGLSVSDICKSRFGSRSLESLDKPCVLDTQQCCDGERRRGHDDHKVCIQCNCDLLRRPDGTSTSRFEYHHSSIEWDLVEAEDGNCRACEKHVKTEMYRDSYGDDLQVDDGDVSEPSKESCRSQLGFYSCLVDQGKMKDDKQLLKLNSGRVKPTAFKTTMSFCCAVGMTQKGGNGRGSSNSSSSSSTESPSRRDKGFKSQVSRCQMLSDDWNGDRPKGFQKYGDRLDDHEASQM